MGGGGGGSVPGRWQALTAALPSPPPVRRHAAQKIQAMQRGKLARRDFQEQRDPAHVHDGVPLSARSDRTSSTVADDTRMVASDGMGRSKRRTKGKMWDTQALHEATLSKAEMIKLNGEQAIERRRQEMMERQAIKETKFRQIKAEQKLKIAAKSEAQSRNRDVKRKKVEQYEKEQERWKQYMYQKIASDARRKAEKDAMEVAVIEVCALHLVLCVCAVCVLCECVVRACGACVLRACRRKARTAARHRV